LFVHSRLSLFVCCQLAHMLSQLATVSKINLPMKQKTPE
jgi:hypothetical protein